MPPAPPADAGLEKKLLQWIHEVIEWGLAKASPKVRVRMEESMDPNLGLPPLDELNMDHFADGRLFLVMVQAIDIKLSKKVNPVPLGRIAQFQTICRDFKVPTHQLFSPPDLWPAPASDPGRVWNCVRMFYSLLPETYDGPVIGGSMKKEEKIDKLAATGVDNLTDAAKRNVQEGKDGFKEDRLGPRELAQLKLQGDDFYDEELRGEFATSHKKDIDAAVDGLPVVEVDTNDLAAVKELIKSQEDAQDGESGAEGTTADATTTEAPTEADVRPGTPEGAEGAEAAKADLECVANLEEVDAAKQEEAAQKEAEEEKAAAEKAAAEKAAAEAEAAKSAEVAKEAEAAKSAEVPKKPEKVDLDEPETARDVIAALPVLQGFVWKFNPGIFKGSYERRYVVLKDLQISWWNSREEFKSKQKCKSCVNFLVAEKVQVLKNTKEGKSRFILSVVLDGGKKE